MIVSETLAAQFELHEEHINPEGQHTENVDIDGLTLKIAVTVLK